MMTFLFLWIVGMAHAECPINAKPTQVTLRPNMLVIDGLSYPAAGFLNRVAIQEMLQQCEMTAAANSFSEFKRQRRISNLWFGLALPFHVFGIIPGVIHDARARNWRAQTVAAMLDG